MSDKAKTIELKTKISQEQGLSKLPLEISFKQSVAYLDGEAQDWKQVIALGQIAAGINGVQGIVNRVWPKSLAKRSRQIKEKEIASWDGIRADVIIVGAGIVGAAIARELAQFDLDVIIIEKEADVGWGQSKANPGWVHAFAGIDVDPKSTKAKLCVRGNKMYDKLARELDFPFKRNGLLAIVTEKDLLPLLNFVKDLAESHGTEVEIIRDREEIFQREPWTTDRALAALYFPTYGSTSPYLATIALIENAVANGAKLLLEAEVSDVIIENGKIKGVMTNRGKVSGKFLVNAAGLYADEIAEMAGAREFTIHPRKGEMLIFDSKYSFHYSSNLAPATIKTDPYTKGGGIAISTEGNSIWGPHAEEIPFKDDTETTMDAMEAIWKKFSFLVPRIPKEAIIASFAGVRAATYIEDFCIAPSRKIKGLINVAGIQSPGTAAAPAIAKKVLAILRRKGLYLHKTSDFSPLRKAPPVFRSLTTNQRVKLIDKDPTYGHVICRCEHVTEGEVLEAIRRGATTLDGVKFRTRAGMGRCQGGFCTPNVIRILAKELQISMNHVTKQGEGSELLPYEIKDARLWGEQTAQKKS